METFDNYSQGQKADDFVDFNWSGGSYILSDEFYVHKESGSVGYYRVNATGLTFSEYNGTGALSGGWQNYSIESKFRLTQDLGNWEIGIIFYSSLSDLDIYHFHIKLNARQDVLNNQTHYNSEQEGLHPPDSLLSNTTIIEGKWYKLKMQLSNEPTKLRALSKVWLDNETEPLTWGLNDTFSSIGAGVLTNGSVGFLATDCIADFDYMVVNVDNFSLCTPDWVCSDYGDCINNSILCNDTIDLNSCGEAYTGNYSEFPPQSTNCNLLQGLVYYYSGDSDNVSADNTTTYDISGQGNDGTNSAGIELRVEGKINEGIRMNSDYINFPQLLLNTVQPRTFCAWIRKEGGFLVNNGVIMQEIRNGAGQREVGINDVNNGGKVVASLRTSTTWFSIYSSSGTTQGNWYHICRTWDGAIPNSNHSLYFNGVLENQSIFTSALGGTNNLGSRIGDGWNLQDPINATLDEIGQWNRSLTASEISQLYNGRLGYNPVLDVSGVSAPEVEVLTPANNTITNILLSTTYNATDLDNATVECSLYLNDVLNLTNSSVIVNATSSFNLDLTEGQNTFYINCSDGENIGLSGTHYLWLDTNDPFLNSQSPLPFNTTIFTGYSMNIFGNITNTALDFINITIFDENDLLYYTNTTSVFGDPTVFAYNWVFVTDENDNGVWDMVIYGNDTATNDNELFLSFTINNCVTDWACDDYNACNSSDLASCNDTIDLNNCNISYTGNYSEFPDQACNYCSYSLNLLNSSDCVSNIQENCYEDINFGTCCNISGIGSDCAFGNSSSGCLNESCSAFEYESGDIAKATIDFITIGIILIGIFIPILVFIFIITWGYNKFKGKR